MCTLNPHRAPTSCAEAKELKCESEGLWATLPASLVANEAIIHIEVTKGCENDTAGSQPWGQHWAAASKRCHDQNPVRVSNWSNSPLRTVEAVWFVSSHPGNAATPDLLRWWFNTLRKEAWGSCRGSNVRPGPLILCNQLPISCLQRVSSIKQYLSFAAQIDFFHVSLSVPNPTNLNPPTSSFPFGNGIAWPPCL